MKIVVVLCMCIGLLAQTVSSHPDLKDLIRASRRYRHRRCQPDPGPSPIKDPKPCKGQVSNGTIETPKGKIECNVPSKEQLLNQLKEIGGANPYYVATTEEEANKFPNLLPNVSLSDIYYCDTSPSGIQHKVKKSQPIWRPKRGRRRCHKEYDDSAGKRSDVPGSKVTSSTCFIDGTRDQNTGRKMLCNRCQQVRKLPTGYFPAYLNELSCGSGKIDSVSSDTCDGGIGDCIQKYLYMPILHYKEDKCKTVGRKTKCKQVWVKETAQIRSCCECQF